VEYGHAAAEAAKHLAKFETYVAGAEDYQMFGNGGQFHDRFVGEIRDGF